MKSFSDYLIKPEENNDVIKNDLKEIKQSGLPVVVLGMGKCAFGDTVHKYRGGVVHVLDDYGINISAFTGTSSYIGDRKSIGNIPVYCIDDLDSIYKNYVIVNTPYGTMNDILFKLKKKQNIKLYDLGGLIFGTKAHFDLTYDFVLENINEFGKTFDLLEDDLSKKVFLSYFQERINCINETMPRLKDLWIDEQYFNSLYDPLNCDENILIDCGAYIGDSALKFIDFCKTAGKPAKAVYSFEPDTHNFEKLKAIADVHKEIKAYNTAVGENSCIIRFENKGAENSCVTDAENGTAINCVKIDDVVKTSKVSMIKMDIEGFEIPALKGCEETIKKCMPVLAICVYHKQDDLIEIPELIEKISSQNALYRYKYFLRHHTMYVDDTVLYCIPTKK